MDILMYKGKQAEFLLKKGNRYDWPSLCLNITLCIYHSAHVCPDYCDRVFLCCPMCISKIIADFPSHILMMYV